MSNSSRHIDQDPEDGIHVIHRYVFDNAADRAAFTNEQSGNPYNSIAPTAAKIGSVARQTDNSTFWVLTNHSPVTWMEFTNVGLTAYSTVQEDGSSLAQQPTLNFVDGLVATNDAGNSRTNVNLTYAAPSVTVKSENTAASAGTATTVLRSDAQIQVATASPTTSVKSEATSAGQGSANTLLRSDAQLQVATASPSTTIKSEATAAAQGSSSSLLRADAQLQAATATPGTNVLSDASTADQGSSSSLLRSDARLIATTAAPSVTAKSEATSAGQGTSTSLLRADAQIQVATAVPTVKVRSDNSTFDQGVASTLLRSDARLIAEIAAPSTIGTANSAGTSTYLAAADHVHNHGDLAGGTLHELAVASVFLVGGSAGFISGTDKERLDTAALQNTPSEFAPLNVNRSAANPGINFEYAAAVDHKHDIDTATPSASINAGDTAAEGSDSNLARAGHRHAVTTAVSGDLAAADAAAASAGTGTAIPRADHKHQVSTGSPSTTIKTDASSASTGSASTLARTDAQWLLATAAPTTAILSDASSAQQGTATTSIRSDARFVATTAAPSNVGGANAQGSSTALARADHVHATAFPVLVFGAETVTPTTTTRYLVPGYGGGTDVPINPVRVYLPRACTLQRMYVAHSQTAGNGNAIVYTVRKNGVASALTVSLASTSNSGSDTSNTVSIAAGDYIDIEVTKASSVVTSPAAITVTIEMVPT